MPFTIFSRRVRVLLRGSKLSWTFVNMGTLKPKIDFPWVINQRPFFVFIFSFNVFLAFTATLSNTLIFIALHKVSSIYPPTKFLLRCLAMSDFCVGVLVQPLFAAFLIGILSGNWRIVKLTLSFFNFFFCGFSLTTATAISVDRLLALLLGLRYRHTVTLRRVRCLVACLLLVVIAMTFMYSLSSRGIANSAGSVIIVISLFLSVNLSQTATASSPSTTTTCWSWTSTTRKRRKNSNEHWTIQKYCLHHSLGADSIGLVLFSIIHVFVLAIATNWYRPGSFFYVCAATVIYFNSTLKPILFCWKIREVRQAVKTTLKQIPCFSSWSRLHFSDVGNSVDNN